MPWVYDPHRGGVNIPEHTKDRTRQRIFTYAEQPYRGTSVRSEGRFRQQFCDSDASTEPVLAEDFPPSFGGTKRGKRGLKLAPCMYTTPGMGR